MPAGRGPASNGEASLDLAAEDQAAEGRAPREADTPRKSRNGDAAAACGPGRAEWADATAAISPDAPLAALLLAASRLMAAFYAGSVAQTGLRISPSGLGVLRVLLDGDGLKSSDVATRGWSSPGTVTTVVDTLVRDGYVERRSDADDRRVVRLFVTEKGRRIGADYDSLAGPYWRDAFDFVSPADEPVIRRFFIDMIKQFDELIRKERGK